MKKLAKKLKEEKEWELIYKYSEKLFQANPIGSVSRNTYYKVFKAFLKAIKKLKLWKI